MSKLVLISKTPIPSKIIGSWNLILSEVINRDKCIFDFIISPSTDCPIEGISVNTEPLFKDRIISKIMIPEYSKKCFWRPLKMILRENYSEKIKVILFDDINLANSIDFFARNEGIRGLFDILFFQRGYSFDISIEKRSKLFKVFDKLIVQTNSSYFYQVATNHAIPCEMHVLPNGIDKSKFYPINLTEKHRLRLKHQLNPNKTYFLWVSQDRPKKGLQIILKVWEKISLQFDDIELIVLGTNGEMLVNNVRWLGVKHKSELTDFYQLTDFYIFSSLCHEGYPNTLIEAISCGAKCIASDIDPISEIISEVNSVILVSKPHIINNWVNLISKILNKEIRFNDNYENPFYSLDQWTENFYEIIES